ncbi:hypothetical protein PG984_008020 [Apiospora sp. TS-2023a]
MASQTPSFDEATRPLMSGHGSEEITSAGHLHPAMIARPLSPPARGYRDEDGKERTWPANQVLMWVLRPASVALALADVVVLLTSSYGHSGLGVTLIVITFIVMFWNMFKLVPKAAMAKLLCISEHGDTDATEVSCTVGRWKLFCHGGDGDEEDGGHSEARKPSLIKRMVGQGLMDLILSFFLMLFDILVANDWYSPTEVTVITSILVGFQYIMIILPHLSSCGPFSITLNYKRDEPYQYRIRLPQDEPAAQSAASGKQPVSVTA